MTDVFISYAKEDFPSVASLSTFLEDHADMERLDAYYDGLLKTDPDLGKIDKKSFREYYALRASVAYSFGSHDEWNIVRAIHEARRASKDYGLARQLGVFFDGRAAAPGLFETPVARAMRARAGGESTAGAIGKALDYDCDQAPPSLTVRSTRATRHPAPVANAGKHAMRRAGRWPASLDRSLSSLSSLLSADSRRVKNGNYPPPRP